MGGLILLCVGCFVLGAVLGVVIGIFYQDRQLAKLIDEEQKTLEKNLNDIIVSGL